MVDAAYHREWRAKNPEKAREAAVRWRTANREKMLAQKRAYNKRHAVRIRAQQAAWRVANIDSAREYERSQGRKRQGLPKPTRPASTVCECCGQPSKASLCIDHDHTTGAFRGWLCHGCNVGIGRLGDNLEGVRLAITYLEKQK